MSGEMRKLSPVRAFHALHRCGGGSKGMICMWKTCEMQMPSSGGSLIAAPTLGATNIRRGKYRRNTPAYSLLQWALIVLFFGHLLTPLEGASWVDRAESGESEESYYDGSDAEDDDEDHADSGVSEDTDDDSHEHKDSVEIEYEESDHNEHSHANAVDESSSSESDPADFYRNKELFTKHLKGLSQTYTVGKSKRSKQLLPPVTISVPYPVHIERKVPVFIETKVPVYVEKKVEVPVDRPYEVPVPVKVPVYEKEVIHVPRPVVYNVDRPYPVYVHRTVYVNKYQPVKVLIKSRTRY
ncbi:hypothetical protein ZHAS_00010771 [Anopheles sinensis]|uniref:Uncharacterized protein n=1 Tax=Anopheles sinensis TaxID=74873 RepID=A0A084VYP5_ANOSI|nr:hypothetical protein ZHAS_00010771 [Anopheles sinensis]